MIRDGGGVAQRVIFYLLFFHVVLFCGICQSSPLLTYLPYKSSVSSDGSGMLDLWAELNYDSTFQNAPIMVVMHGYSPSSGNFDNVRAGAQRLRDNGFFAISVAMRERDGCDGERDSGGVEIFDIYDAVEEVKRRYPDLVDESNVSISGFSGGGGNTMSCLTKFPDYFRVGAAYFGMSDYGFDPVNSWYFKGAGSSHCSIMNDDIGNPTTGDPDVMDRYAARASNLASKNNPYSEIHLFVNHNETTCPVINDTTYRDNAIAAESYPGEFENITVHIGGYGEYVDFNNNGINESDELQNWPHSFPTDDQQHAAEAWFLDRLRSGQIPQPVLNDSDELYVAGYVKTKKFFLWLGDGQNAAAELIYSFGENDINFELNILTNNKTITGAIEINTEDFAGANLGVFLNGEKVSNAIGGEMVTIADMAHGDVLQIKTSMRGDLNGDSEIDLKDLSIFAMEWQKPCAPCNGSDINDDGQVNTVDLAELVELWFNGKYVTFYRNNLDSDPGWQVQGQWQFGVPLGLGGQLHGNPDPTTAASGDYVYGVNLLGDYLPFVSGPYSLVAGPFDCSNYSDIHLKFKRWLNTDEPAYIRSSIEYSTDCENWSNAWQHEELCSIEDQCWKSLEYELGFEASHEPQLYIRWVYEIINPRVWPFSGWNIDDIELSGEFEVESD